MIKALFYLAVGLGGVLGVAAGMFWLIWNFFHVLTWAEFKRGVVFLLFGANIFYVAMCLRATARLLNSKVAMNEDEI